MKRAHGTSSEPVRQLSGRSELADLIQTSVDQVVSRVILLLAKIIADGVPACGIISDPIQALNQPRVKELSENDLHAIAIVEGLIQDQARTAVCRLVAAAFTAPDIEDALVSDVRKLTAKRMTADIKSKRTKPIEDVLRANPELSSKNLLAKLLTDKVMRLENDQYVINETGAKIKSTSWDPKISRLRKKLSM